MTRKTNETKTINKIKTQASIDNATSSASIWHS